MRKECSCDLSLFEVWLLLRMLERLRNVALVVDKAGVGGGLCEIVTLPSTDDTVTALNRREASMRLQKVAER